MITILHQQLLTGTSPEPATTFLYQQLQTATSPAAAITFLHQQLPALQLRSPSCTSNYHQLPVLNQLPPSCTSNYQLLPGLNQWPPSWTSSNQAWTNDHLPAPAATSPEPATIFMHQQMPVLHQRPLIQRLPVLYQLSRPAPATRSCSNDLHPVAVTVRHTLFRFTIRHNKVWPFEVTALFCPSCLVRCQSLIFQRFVGTGIFIWPLQHIHPPSHCPVQQKRNYFKSLTMYSGGNKYKTPH